MKKFLSLMLVCFLLIGSFPLSANASEVAESTAPVETTSVEETVAVETTSVEETVADETTSVEETVSEEQIAAWEKYSALITGMEPVAMSEEETAQFMSGDMFRSPNARAADVYEVEPNDSASLADRVWNGDTAVGTLSTYDMDYFKFVLNSTSEVTIAALSTREEFIFGIFDIWDECVAVGLPLGYYEGYYAHAMIEELPAGTYYVCVMPLDTRSITYSFKIGWESTYSHTHSYSATTVVDATCTNDGYTTYTCSCGDSYTEYSYAFGHSYTDVWDPNCNNCGEARQVSSPATADATPMYRLYNPNSGEHFYTRDIYEREMLISVGWSYEGIAWYAPLKNGNPVYRLYNPNAGEHHYTTSAGERNMLISVGWKDEGIGWLTAGSDQEPIYRVYNPNEFANNHHYTRDVNERNMLVGIGWKDEGIGWYGVYVH